MHARGREFDLVMRMCSLLKKRKIYNKKRTKGGLDHGENPAEKRMYSSENSSRCPVRSLKALIERTDPSATSPFNHCVKNASLDENIRYSKTSVKQYQFSRFMSDISRNADCSRIYTPHSLHATAIQRMNDAGYQIRHIMHMSGHKDEG